MSSRALRRALREREEEQPVDDCTEAPEEMPGHKDHGKSGNLFSAFAELELDDNDGTESDLEPTASQCESVCPEPGSPTVRGKGRGKPKKEEKKVLKAAPRLLNEDMLECLPEDTLDAVPASSGFTLFCDALKVDSNWLDPNVELKRKFGGSVAAAGSVMTRVAGRMLRGHDARTGRKVAAIKPYKRRNGLVSPRVGWPIFNPGDTNLKISQDPSEPFGYRIEMTGSYAEEYDEFAILVETADLDGLMVFAQERPLFVDAILTLSDAFRMQSTGDAGELTENALYILERIMPSEANLLEGRCRFRYVHQPNRKFHLALFRLIQFTMKKSCWRVALQQAKTLLSLDPENDPLAARLFLDFIALQAGDLEAFDQLSSDEFLSRLCLVDLPGWRFARALRLHIDKATRDTSGDELVSAIKAFPFMANLLIQAMKLKMPEDWHVHYERVREASESDLAGMAASRIAVARSLPLWKQPDIDAWLLKALKEAMVCLSPEHLVSLSKSTSPSAQLSLYRHSILTDLSGVNVAIPDDVTAACGGIHSHDPLCPEMFEDSSGPRVLSVLQSLWSSIASRRP